MTALQQCSLAAVSIPIATWSPATTFDQGGGSSIRQSDDHAHACPKGLGARHWSAAVIIDDRKAALEHPLVGKAFQQSRGLVQVIVARGEECAKPPLKCAAFAGQLGGSVRKLVRWRREAKPALGETLTATLDPQIKTALQALVPIVKPLPGHSQQDLRLR